MNRKLTIKGRASVVDALAPGMLGAGASRCDMIRDDVAATDVHGVVYVIFGEELLRARQAVGKMFRCSEGLPLCVMW